MNPTCTRSLAPRILPYEAAVAVAARNFLLFIRESSRLLRRALILSLKKRCMATPTFETIVDSSDPSLFDIRSKAPGPKGALPISADMLLHRPSGDLFGLTQDAGMGWDPSK